MKKILLTSFIVALGLLGASCKMTTAPQAEEEKYFRTNR